MFEANDECLSRFGTQLASIHSETQNIQAHSSVNSNRCWIGLNDQTIEGTFEWFDGSNIDYTNWDNEQPNNYRGQDCVEIYTSNGAWNDLGCNEDDILYYFVCNHPNKTIHPTTVPTKSPTLVPTGYPTESPTEQFEVCIFVCCVGVVMYLYTLHSIN